jgi:hypothetical protein
VDEPFKHAPVNIVSAKEAYELVLSTAGANLPKRDPVDERVVQMVRTGQVSSPASVPDVRERLAAVKFTPERINEIISLAEKGIIYHPDLVGGYPQYGGTPRVDTDSDGMPDDWETSHGLNPKDATDAARDLNGDGYTNIEKYINRIDPKTKVDWRDLKNNKDTLAAK